MADLEKIVCEHKGVSLVGRLARPSSGGTGPLVLVFPSALGLGEHALESVQRLADAGYHALGIDMYGDGLAVGYTEGAKTGAFFQELTSNPPLLRERMLAWLDVARALPGVDANRIAAIGYCFGGFCVLEFARTGAELKAVVSYHGILTTQLPAGPGTIKAHVAAFCGARDPYAPLGDIDELRTEMSEAGASYSITVYGDAEHSFTDPRAGGAGMAGISYNLAADRTSWASTLALFDAVV